MRRSSLVLLPKITRQQRRRLRALGFESAAKSRSEDRLRAQKLRSRSAANCPYIDQEKARALAGRIDPDLEQVGFCDSLSSSTYLRTVRGPVACGLTQFTWVNRAMDCSIFALVCEAGVKNPDQLAECDAAKFMASLRSDLNRCGAARLDGCLIAFIHVEFEPFRRLFVVHIHGIVLGDMIEAIDRLRQRRKYHRVAGNDRDMVPISRPVWRTHKPIKERMYACSYLLKSVWTARWIGPRDACGNFPRRRRGQRIPEPYHSQLLLWMDQFSVQDITLMIGMEAGRFGFRRTRRKLHKAKPLGPNEPISKSVANQDPLHGDAESGSARP